MLKRRRSTGLIVVVMVFSLVSSGCLSNGQFAAFTKISRWNQTATSNRFVNEAIFFALNIVPVYGLAYLADIVVFNSIEFWTGHNPMMAESDRQQIVESGDIKVVQTFHQSQALKIMEVKYYVKERLTQTLTLSQQAGSQEFNGMVERPEGNKDRFVIRAEEANLGLTRFSPDGHFTTEVIEGAALAALTEKVARLMDHQPVYVASAH